VATPGRLICTHRFLRAVQDAGINGCQFLYPTVYAGDRLVAHTSMYLITSELDMFGDGWLGKLVGGAARRFPALTRFFSLECGTPVALGTTISMLPDVDRPAVLRLLSDEAKRLAREHRTDGILFRDFLDSELGEFGLFGDLGFLRVPNLPVATLNVPWKTTQAYEADLRHSYRRAYRRRRRVLAEAGVTARVVVDFAPLANELAGLWRQVYDRASEYRREILPPAFFTRISEELGEESSVLLLEKDERPLAFALLLREENQLLWPYCGLDYAVNEQYELYFNLLYEIVHHAIRLGVPEVDMGITTLDAKKRVGATVQPLHMYMRHCGLLFREIGPRLFRLLTPGDGTPDYRVFKNSSEPVE
jgi:predicted N-acyltransferase